MREGYGFVGRALAAAGFVVVIPDYLELDGHPGDELVLDECADYFDAAVDGHDCPTECGGECGP